MCVYLFFTTYFFINCFVLNRFKELVCSLSTLQRYGRFVVLKIGIFFNFQGGFCKLLILLFVVGILFVYWMKLHALWLIRPLYLWFNTCVSSLIFIIFLLNRMNSWYSCGSWRFLCFLNDLQLLLLGTNFWELMSLFTWVMKHTYPISSYIYIMVRYNDYMNNPFVINRYYPSL